MIIVSELQAEVRKVQDWKWPEDKNKSGPTFYKLSEEVGELAKALNYNEPLNDVGKEIADVIICAIGLAERLGIDTDKFLELKWNIVKDRLGYTEAQKQPWEQMVMEH